MILKIWESNHIHDPNFVLCNDKGLNPILFSIILLKKVILFYFEIFSFDVILTQLSFIKSKVDINKHVWKLVIYWSIVYVYMKIINMYIIVYILRAVWHRWKKMDWNKLCGISFSFMPILMYANFFYILLFIVLFEFGYINEEGCIKSL